MASKVSENVFDRFNKWPFENQFRHANGLIRQLTGTKREHLDQIQVSPPPKDLDCSHLGDRAERLWQAQLTSRGNRRASLMGALFRCLIWDYFEAMVVGLVCHWGAILLLVESMRRLFIAIENFHTPVSANLLNIVENVNLSTNGDILGGPQVIHFGSHSQEAYNNLLLLAISVLFSLTAYIVLTTVSEYLYRRSGLKCRIVMTQLIRRKSLRLNMSSSIQNSSQKALSLITNEVDSMEAAHRFLYYILIGPGAIVITVTWLAVTQFSWEPSVWCVPIIFVLVAITTYLPTIYKRINERKKLETDKRLDIISTALSSMKVVKLYAWESQFYKKIVQLREKEMKLFNYLDYFIVYDLVSLSLSSKIISSVVFIVTILKSGTMDRKILLTTTVAYSLWRSAALYFLPFSIRALADMATACKNIKRYLLLDEFKDQRLAVKQRGAKVSIVCEDVGVSFCQNPPTEAAMQTAIAAKATDFRELSTLSPLNSNLIDGLDLIMDSGDLVFVVGSVGSGKSSLLLTLLGETKITKGQLTIGQGSRFAYAAQEACLISDTLRNNILNGRNFDCARYNKVIDVCSLRKDLKQLPHGDQTLVGSKGVALSGGQKARLSLARAVYSDADIYLLDDPLSALDGRVGAEIFANCIRGFLKGKLVVLATHQWQFIESANKIVLLKRYSKPTSGLTRDLLARAELRTMIEQFKKSSSMEPSNQMHTTHTQEKTEITGRIEEANMGSTGDSSETTLESGSSKAEVEAQDDTQAYGYFFNLGFRNLEIVPLILGIVLDVISGSLLEYYFRIWSDNIALIKAAPTFEIPMAHGDGPGSVFEFSRLWLIYMAIIVFHLLTSLATNLVFARGLRRASARLHKLLVESLFLAKMSFFDFCQSGDLGSRFAGDFAIVDHSVVYLALVILSAITEVVTAIIPMFMISPVLLIPTIVLLVTVLPIMDRKYKDSRFLLSLGKSLRSPMFTNLTWTIEEIATVRSEQDHLNQTNRQFKMDQNRLTSASLISIAYDTTLSLAMEFCLTIMNGIIFYMIFCLQPEEVDLSTTGTFLVLLVNVSNFLTYTLENGAVLRGTIMSVASIRKYTQLEPEAGKSLEPKNGTLVGPSAKCGPTKWTTGQVDFDRVTMYYFRDKRPAIEDLTLTIRGGERVGVVGRTGAGKSSIVSALYRLYPFEGNITIDGVDTKSLELDELRASLGVIPQDPVIFSDSLRRNLDPSEEFTDEQLWRALEVVNLRQVVQQNSPEGLQLQMSEGGRNFSVGQRQLICLARAILRSPKILLIDEATANVDSETDALIQTTIRAHFKNSTIITVAHRLNTVLDYDRIMVLDAGRVVEFDSVAKLLQLEGGHFRKMLQNATDSATSLS